MSDPAISPELIKQHSLMPEGFDYIESILDLSFINWS